MFEREEQDMIEQAKIDREESKINRRDFVKYGGYGLGAAFAASTLGNLGAKVVSAESSEEDSVKPTIPPEMEARINAQLKNISWPLTGAQVFAKACKAEGLTAQFMAPGNYSVIHALAEEGILTVSGRCERGTAHAADGFTRASGEIALCSGTEGPGFVNMINGIASAHFARTPMLAVASNQRILADDTEATLQDMYQQPTTEGIKKYGKRMINPKRIMEYTGYAFRQALSGETGVVHLDFPAEITGARFDGPGEQIRSWGPDEYRTEHAGYPDPKAIEKAAKLIADSQRPLIISSQGVFYHEAWEALMELAEKGDIPVCESGTTQGQFPMDHRLSANMAYDAYYEADLIIYVGQYCMPPAEERGFMGAHAHVVNQEAPRIQIEPAPEKIGRNIPAAVGIPCDEKVALEALADAIPAMNRTAWVNRIQEANQAFREEWDGWYDHYQDFNEAVHAAVYGKVVCDYFYSGEHMPKEQTTIVTGGFGNDNWFRRYLSHYRPGQNIRAPYQFGSIGLDVGVALGTALAVKEGIGVQAPYKGAPVVCITSDAAFGFTGFEIETMAKYKLPVITLIYNNDSWGTWRGQKGNPLTEHIHLFQQNLRYDIMAEGLGCHGEYVTKPGDLLPALERCYEVAVNDNQPSVINVQGIKEFWLADEYPPGFQGPLNPGILTVSH